MPVKRLPGMPKLLSAENTTFHLHARAAIAPDVKGVDRLEWRTLQSSYGVTLPWVPSALRSGTSLVCETWAGVLGGSGERVPKREMMTAPAA